MTFKVSRRALLLGGLVGLTGCSAWDRWTMRSQSPEEAESEIREINLVGDLAVPFNMHPMVLENVGLVTGLKGTGSDPKPSAHRSALISEMQTRGVSNPNTVLATTNTSLVLVRGMIRPGIQEGDRFDVEVRVPAQSETTSLRGGYLLETRLKEMAVIDASIRSGHSYALSGGAVLVDPSADPKKDKILPTRGRILGGGVARKSRPLGLVLPQEQQSAHNTFRIQEAINRRFHMFDKGIKTGMAKAKDDKYVELKLHPRYKDNLARYVAVVRSIVLRESEAERSRRLDLLEKQLLDPISSSRAALQLEAIGKDGCPVLLKGIMSSDPEVRFYAAESLAYLDETKAAEPLGEAARNEPAFRMFAMTALSAMDDYAAAEQLRNLLHVPSAETRYGAFRALWAMNSREAAIRGEQLGGQFGYHVIDTEAPPMIHVTRSKRAEVVLFGRDQRLTLPVTLEAGNNILVTGRNGDEVVVSKFALNEPVQKRTVSTRVDDVIRAVVELGGTYPDVVQALQQAKSTGALATRLEVDALPQAGRRYDRLAKGEKNDKPQPVANSPVPELFKAPETREDDEEKSVQTEVDDEEPKEEKGRVRSFFDRMLGRKDA